MASPITSSGRLIFPLGTMKPSTLLLSAVSFVTGASMTFAVVRWFAIDKPELAFVVGAILGTQVAAVFHHRTVGAANTVGVKCVLGIVLALTAALFGFALHSLFAPFKFADVSIPISALGAFAFPFAIFNTMWSALSKPLKGV